MKICATCSELYSDEAAFCPSDGAELKRSIDPYLGRTIAARYRLIKRLGSGGMSVVYLARHVMIDRMSAIKILRQDLGMSPTHRERFLREARAVNRINHANIVEITDFGETDGLAYLVMEYVMGDSLLAHVKRGRFVWARAARVAQQIASALARAHQTGIIHRDLKPENVLLVPRGEEEMVKLTDFGIAKMIDAPKLTFSEQLFGTPGYIAPEYVEGIPADGRADLYSLGVVLYEMLTGLLPYESRSQADLMLAPLTTAPIPPSTRVDGLSLPPDLESLVLRMLARRAEDRPRDAFEVADALGDVLRRFGSTSRRPPPPSGSTAIPEAGESRPTLIEMTPRASALPASGQERLTANVGKVPTMNIASRWHGAIADVDEAIARARRRGDRKAADKAADLASQARTLVANVERASATVGEHQGRADRLEARGRAFRANLGHAIDELVHDRSRERAHADAVRSRQGTLDGDRGATGDLAREALLWETAALEEEGVRAEQLERDLSFQIATLQKTLDGENEQLDRELVEATGALEGSLSALRLLTSELVRLLDEAAKLVSEEKRA